MLIPNINTPFPLTWGFSTRKDKDIYPAPIKLIQVHGITIVEASESNKQADGLWTQTPNLPIGVVVADCIPILLAGLINKRPWVAAIHAGWRGTVAGIFRQGIYTFTQLGGNVKDLTWAFGPAIQKCHFEVGKEVVEIAKKDSVWRNDLIEPAPMDRFYLDLFGLLRAQGLSMGLDATKDGSIPLCTYCSPNLLNSYRRDKCHERQWGWIKIV